jgi:hypothetical protein
MDEMTKIIKTIARIILIIAVFFGFYYLLGAKITFIALLITLLIIALRKNK